MRIYESYTISRLRANLASALSEVVNNGRRLVIRQSGEDVAIIAPLQDLDIIEVQNTKLPPPLQRDECIACGKAANRMSGPKVAFDCTGRGSVFICRDCVALFHDAYMIRERYPEVL
jgi:PHD/YefM family antitoxin component YafN of YafNO toxin-antitoxin module